MIEEKSSILILEEDVQVQKQLTELLLSSAYCVQETASVPDAVSFFEKTKMNLILADVRVLEHSPKDEVASFSACVNYFRIPVILLLPLEEKELPDLGIQLELLDYTWLPFGNLFSMLIIRIQKSLELAKFRNDMRNLVRQKTKHIEQIQKQVTIGLATLVEKRDFATGEHVFRTSILSKLIAQEIFDRGLFCGIIDENYIEYLEMAAPLHDIGKILISDAILNKKSSLTLEESKLMHEHTVLGASIIKEIMTGVQETGYLDMASDIALYHHEFWNGTGYPYGLKGEDIPLSARIMALADVFDALMSRRSYKESFSFDKAFTLIAEGSGRQFDPRITDVFLALKAKIEEVYKQCWKEMEREI